MKIGVLAFQGDVIEHIQATKEAAKKLNFVVEVLPVRTTSSLSSLDGLIIPGGESTTIYKLCQREDMLDEMKKIKAIFGTCAGAIMLAKDVLHKAESQGTLELMDITVDRNAYGAQIDSFEEKFHTAVGIMNAIFIRAPKIKKIGDNIKVIASKDKEVVACEQRINNSYYLACTFHPELINTLMHEYFLSQIS